MRRLAVLLGAVLIFLSPGTICAKTVTVTGIGRTVEESENDALRRAVETAVGVLVDSETLVEKGKLISDQIYTNSRGFITDYKVQNQRQISDGLWETAIVADVNDNPDSKLMSELTRLGIIENRLRNPKIAVYIPERHIQYRIPDPAGETAVVKSLIEAGFSNVIAASPKLSGASYEWVSKSYRAMNLEDMRLAARFFEADIIVMGEAFSEGVGDPARWLPGRQSSGLHSCRARVEAKMYIARTGQIIASDGTYGSGLDISQAVASKKALATAGKQMGEYLTGEIMKLGAGNRQGLEIIVTGSDFSKINAVQAALGQVRGVKNPRLANYADGRGVFTVQYSGSPQTLFRDLSAAVEAELILSEASYNTLTIAVR